MNTERKEFMSVIRLPPARVVAEEAAWILGFAPHDIPVLVNAGLLKPSRHLPVSGTKYFATATLLKLRDDLHWLSRASDTTLSGTGRVRMYGSSAVLSQLPLAPPNHCIVRCPNDVVVRRKPVFVSKQNFPWPMLARLLLTEKTWNRKSEL
jgi:hypothetical protein